MRYGVCEVKISRLDEENGSRYLYFVLTRGWWVIITFARAAGNWVRCLLSDRWAFLWACVVCPCAKRLASSGSCNSGRPARGRERRGVLFPAKNRASALWKIILLRHPSYPILGLFVGMAKGPPSWHHIDCLYQGEETSCYGPNKT